MAKIIKKKAFYRIVFKLLSPLAISSGENSSTDQDIILNSESRPYIPASSLAGAVRDLVAREEETENPDGFGYIIIAGENTEAKAEESRLIFYDADLQDEAYTISVRDNVSLDEYRTARDGAKFDREVLEPGVSFTTWLEENFYNDGDVPAGLRICEYFTRGEVFLGGKNRRGYGALETTSVEEACFDLTKADEVDKWLAFDLEGKEGWTDKTSELPGPKERKNAGIRLKLKQMGGISIRRYTTDLPEDDENQDKTGPDQEQLTVHIGEDVKPAIPGTSWAGTIRHRVEELVRPGKTKDETERLMNAVFGFVKGDNSGEKQISGLRFSESFIDNAHDVTLSRVAIDRFSGGASDQALFTEKTWYGGETELTVQWLKKEPMPEEVQAALAAALTDLHFGFLAVGGESSIGRGLFRVESVNGTAVDDKTVFETIKSAVKEACEGWK